MDLRIVLKLLLEDIVDEITLSSRFVHYLVHNKEVGDGCICGGYGDECPAHIPFKSGDSVKAMRILYDLSDELVDAILMKK